MEPTVPDLILRLALPSPLRRLFDYLPPAGVSEQLLQPGVRLRVPFGRREVIAVLIERASHSSLPADKLRPALALLDRQPLLPASLFRLCQWTAQYYQHSLGDTFSWALPVLLRQGEAAEARVERFWVKQPQASLDDPRLLRAPRQREALRTLAQHPHGIAHSLLGQLQEQREALLVDQVLRVVEKQSAAFQGVALEALRIAGEGFAQVEMLHGLALRMQGRPGGQGGDVHGVEKMRHAGKVLMSCGKCPGRKRPGADRA